jgi:methionine aminotransferase
VACIPVSVFYAAGQDHQVLRFCFAKKEEELEEALRRIQKVATIF